MRRVIEACAYAARKHVDQRRNGAAAEPYVNHVIDVAARVAQSPMADADLIIAALLHDIVEDTDGTAAEIAALFGDKVAAIVLEVTDDKSLPKAERKRLQVATVALKSDAAKRVKLADKASNLNSLVASPPQDWSQARKLAYVDWAEEVGAGLMDVDATLEATFRAAIVTARRAHSI